MRHPAAPAGGASPPDPPRRASRDTSQREAVPRAHAIEVRGLTVASGERVLFDGASLAASPGELVLLVGGSGTGKSVLLSLLAGLADSRPATLSIEGEVRTAGRVGMVFQDGALLDDFSALANVLFALDHAPGTDGGESRTERARALLDEVRIRHDLVLSRASGGERRRVALARALAGAPDILLYDEPTAGLDPELAIHVGELIRRTHEARRMTTLVVTHDFQALAPIASRIVFLDPRTKLLVEVSRADLDRLVADGSFQAPPGDATKVPATRPARLAGFFEEWGRRSGAFVATIAGSLVPRWKKARWGLAIQLHYLRLVGGPTSLLYMALAGAVIGFVGVYFTFKYLPYAPYLRPLVTEDLLGAIGFALYRILVPILATILIAARSGAAAASDLAGRSFRQEFDALRTLGASPEGYHGFAAISSLTVATPVLVLASFFVARAVAMATYGLWDPAARSEWVEVLFHASLRGAGPFYIGTGWLVAKTLVAGFLVGVATLGLSRSPKRTPSDVSNTVTRTVLVSTVLVLLVHFVFAFLEF